MFSFLQAAIEEATQYLGMSMTFTIFEFVKENLDKLLQDQPDVIVAESRVDESLGKLDIKGSSPALLRHDFTLQCPTSQTHLIYAIKSWV